MYDFATRVPQTNRGVSAGSVASCTGFFEMESADKPFHAAAAWFSRSASAPRQRDRTNCCGRSPSHQIRGRTLDERLGRRDDRRTCGRPADRAVRTCVGCDPTARAVARRSQRCAPHPRRCLGARLRRPRMAWMGSRPHHALVRGDARWDSYPYVWRAHRSEGVLLMADRPARHHARGRRAQRRRRCATWRARAPCLRRGVPAGAPW